MLPSGPTVRPSTLLCTPGLTSGRTVSVSTLPRSHAMAGTAPRSPVVSPRAAAVSLKHCISYLPLLIWSACKGLKVPTIHSIPPVTQGRPSAGRFSLRYLLKNDGKGPVVSRPEGCDRSSWLFQVIPSRSGRGGGNNRYLAELRNCRAVLLAEEPGSHGTIRQYLRRSAAGWAPSCC